MGDVLRATRGVAGFHAAMQLVLVEASPVLRETQADTLKGYAPQWVDTADQLPNAPLFLLANEFFDALPIRQYIRDGDAWRERMVGVQDHRLVFGLGEAMQQPALNARLLDTRDGDTIETIEATTPVTFEIASRISGAGGAAIVVDYGDWQPIGDTFQAVKKHQKIDPLGDCGEADLTAHVDFSALATTAQEAGAVVSAMTPQGVFLERLGITQRAQNLAQNLSGRALDDHIAAHRRLTHPEEMGTLFKVLGLTPPNAPPIAGLDM